MYDVAFSGRRFRVSAQVNQTVDAGCVRDNKRLRSSYGWNSLKQASPKWSLLQYLKWTKLTSLWMGHKRFSGLFTHFLMFSQAFRLFPIWSFLGLKQVLKPQQFSFAHAGCSNIMAFLSLRCDEVVLSSSSFSNAYEGTLPSSLSRFGGPRIFSGQDTESWLQRMAKQRCVYGNLQKNRKVGHWQIMTGQFVLPRTTRPRMTHRVSSLGTPTTSTWIPVSCSWDRLMPLSCKWDRFTRSIRKKRFVILQAWMPRIISFP